MVFDPEFCCCRDAKSSIHAENAKKLGIQSSYMPPILIALASKVLALNVELMGNERWTPESWSAVRFLSFRNKSKSTLPLKVIISKTQKFKICKPTN